MISRLNPPLLFLGHLFKRALKKTLEIALWNSAFWGFGVSGLHIECYTGVIETLDEELDGSPFYC